MRIVFIGSGNIAFFFATRLHRKGHEITQVYSRTRAHGDLLAALTHSNVTDNLDEIIPDADVYILAIKDDVLEEMAARLSFKNKTVIHCAGAVPLEVLGNISENKAVIWSLYSIRKSNLPKGNNVPLIVEANTPAAATIALKLAHDISDTVLETDFRQRQLLHVGAVFANNFTNHLFSIAQQLCEEHGLPFEVLHPIIRQTTQQIGFINPTDSQTGPAARNDTTTIQRHLNLLEPHPDWQKIYADISNAILKENKL